MLHQISYKTETESTSLRLTEHWPVFTKSKSTNWHVWLH